MRAAYLRSKIELTYFWYTHKHPDNKDLPADSNRWLGDNRFLLEYSTQLNSIDNPVDKYAQLYNRWSQVPNSLCLHRFLRSADNICQDRRAAKEQVSSTSFSGVA